MHKQLDALLCARYPQIFSGRGNEAFSLFGFECGDGWFNLIDSTCSLVQKHSGDTPERAPLIASQVKEKFGELRFYHRNVNEYATQVIDLAEALSGSICEVCGSLGEMRETKGWIQARCVAHKLTPIPSEAEREKLVGTILLGPSLSEVMHASLNLFDMSAEHASIWLKRPARALAGGTPLEAALSAEGQKDVLKLIYQIEYGVIP